MNQRQCASHPSTPYPRARSRKKINRCWAGTEPSPLTRRGCPLFPNPLYFFGAFCLRGKPQTVCLFASSAGVALISVISCCIFIGWLVDAGCRSSHALKRSARLSETVRMYFAGYVWSQHCDNNHPSTSLTALCRTTVLEQTPKVSPCFSHDGSLFACVAGLTHQHGDFNSLTNCLTDNKIPGDALLMTSLSHSSWTIT